jgi:DNA-binding response OmpR family regulator
MAATILLCDNEEPLRALVRATFVGENYEFVEARDGEEALDLARTMHPDLILLDMMMPGHSGLEVLVELRNEPAFARTPVIMLTARTQAADRDAAAAAGADRFLAKPFRPGELMALVDEVLAARA